MPLSASGLWGWAKTNKLRPTDSAFAWLSLLDHGLDVAAVFRALAEGPYRGMMQALFGRIDDGLLDGLVALAGLHDLAKASWTFQGMTSGPTPLPKPLAFGYIHHSEEACGLLWEAHRTALPGFAAALRPQIDLNDPDDRSLLRAAFSHHGLPQNGRAWENQRDLAARMRPLAGGHDGRDPVFLVRELAEALPIRSGPHPLAALDHVQRNAALHGLMGLINLADWIGSSTVWFPLLPKRPDNFDRWWAARRALAEIGWPLVAFGHATDDDAIRQVLALYTGGQARTLRPAQTRIVEAIKADPPRPGDVIVLEDETGGGKTLAAYLVHALLARRGLCTGLTFCLPTRASAREIHKGAVQVYGERTLPVLAVGGYENAPALPGLADNEREAGRAGLGWAAQRRHRFLAAPVAVGTVDQVLLGALTVRFAHLRQVAPACNLLVVDEVHSSDPYMRGLLREVVQRRRASGGITLLMSATLGADLRKELLAQPMRAVPAAATAGRPLRGTGRPAARQPVGTDAVVDGAGVHYPALWLKQDSPVPLSNGVLATKNVVVEPCDEWQESAASRVAAQAVAAARAGARVLVIRNTVGLARATAIAIAALDPSLMLCLNSHPVCHHARFAAEDRFRLDGLLMAALDPRPRSRGPGIVAVTTQTAEQSLDVDADLLITDLVPSDVLLQRIGRLHRNRSVEATASRPTGFTVARCVVLAPAAPAAMLQFAASPGRGPNGWGTDRAYADTLALAATRDMIAGGACWDIPRQNRSLVEGATSGVARNALAIRFGPAGATAKLRISARALFQNEARQQVSWSYLEDPAGRRLCQSELFETRADNKAATRLGLFDVRIDVDPPFRSPFGEWMIAAVMVPGWLALIANMPGDVQATWQLNRDGVELLVKGHEARFTYGPFGLALQPESRRL